MIKVAKEIDGYYPANHVYQNMIISQSFKIKYIRWTFKPVCIETVI